MKSGDTLYRVGPSGSYFRY